MKIYLCKLNKQDPVELEFEGSDPVVFARDMLADRIGCNPDALIILKNGYKLPLNKKLADCPKSTPEDRWMYFIRKNVDQPPPKVDPIATPEKEPVHAVQPPQPMPDPVQQRDSESNESEYMISIPEALRRLRDLGFDEDLSYVAIFRYHMNLHSAAEAIVSGDVDKWLMRKGATATQVRRRIEEQLRRRDAQQGVDTQMIDGIVQMGFTREQAVQALQKCGGDPNAAVEYLFTEQNLQHELREMYESSPSISESFPAEVVQQICSNPRLREEFDTSAIGFMNGIEQGMQCHQLPPQNSEMMELFAQFTQSERVAINRIADELGKNPLEVAQLYRICDGDLEQTRALAQG